MARGKVARGKMARGRVARGNVARGKVARGKLLFAMIDAILYYPLGLTESLTDVNWQTRINYMFFVCHFFLFTMQSAYATLKVSLQNYWACS